MITLGLQNAPPLQAQVEALVAARASSFRLDVMDAARGAANGGPSSFIRVQQNGPLSLGTEASLCSRGQKALTKSRFIRKVNTRFYHAHPAICSNRAHKQPVDHPSIPDPAVAGPRPILAPYDDSTSSGSSTGDPESATSD